MVNSQFYEIETEILFNSLTLRANSADQIKFGSV